MFPQEIILLNDIFHFILDFKNLTELNLFSTCYWVRLSIKNNRGCGYEHNKSMAVENRR